VGIPLFAQGILPRYFRLRGADYFRPCWLFFRLRRPLLLSDHSILGGTCVGIVETFSTGCVLIGPVGVGLISGAPRVDRAEGGPFEPPYWNNAY
jgi:hypothetical protein